MLKKVLATALLVVSLAADSASANPAATEEPPLFVTLHAIPDPIIIIFDIIRSLRC